MRIRRIRYWLIAVCTTPGLALTLMSGAWDQPSNPNAAPTSADLLVASHADDSVLRYDSTTGAFLDVFISSGSGGLDGPRGMAFGRDGNLYVASRDTDRVLRYNGTTGAFIDEFVSAGSGGLDGPVGLVFGPRGDLYVCSRNTSSILRYDGTLRAFWQWGPEFRR